MIMMTIIAGTGRCPKQIKAMINSKYLKLRIIR